MRAKSDIYSCLVGFVSLQVLSASKDVISCYTNVHVIILLIYRSACITFNGHFLGELG